MVSLLPAQGVREVRSQEPCHELDSNQHLWAKDKETYTLRTPFYSTRDFGDPVRRKGYVRGGILLLFTPVHEGGLHTTPPSLSHGKAIKK